MHTPNQLSHPADNIFSTEPLGAIYTPEQTTFRVWAPTAGKVTLKLYDSPSGGRPGRRTGREGQRADNLVAARELCAVAARNEPSRL